MWSDHSPNQYKLATGLSDDTIITLIPQTERRLMQKLSIKPGIRLMLAGLKYTAVRVSAASPERSAAPVHPLANALTGIPYMASMA